MGIDILIMDIIFIIVIPDIGITLINQYFPYALFPEIIGFRIGEVQIAGIAAPEREFSHCAVFIMQEPVMFGDIVI